MRENPFLLFSPRPVPNLFTLTAAAVLSMALVAPARALERPEVGLRVSLYEDVVHAPGSLVVSARYGGGWGLRLGAWVRDSHVEGGAPDKFGGIDHVWKYRDLRAGLGAVWIDDTTKLNGTHWDFDVSLAYDVTRRVFVEYHHFSHGKKLGIDNDVPNGGWNLLGVGWIF